MGKRWIVPGEKGVGLREENDVCCGCWGKVIRGRDAIFFGYPLGVASNVV